MTGSYNDLYEGCEFRDHIGEVIYQRVFSLPPMGDLSRYCCIVSMGRIMDIQVSGDDQSVYTENFGGHTVAIPDCRSA